MASSETPKRLQISLENCKDISKCIICQKLKDNKGNQKLTSTEKGRGVIVECSKLLNDDLLEGIPDSQYENIQYHINTCYPRYVRSKERSEKKADIVPKTPEFSDEPSKCSSSSSEGRFKRRKLMGNENTSIAFEEKPCVICNQMKSKGDTKRLRICEATRANLFLSAIKFNKDVVYTRCALIEKPGDVYAADIMYHKNCLSNYLRKFEREVEAIMNPPVTIVENSKFHKLFLDFVKTINLKIHAYSLSDCRQLFNEILEKEKETGDFIF